MANRRSALFFIISGVLTFGACGGAPETRSRFLSSFSARDVVEKSYDSPTGNAGFRVSGGEASVLLGSRRTYHRNERADLNISQSDEASFLPRIKEQIEQHLHTTGSRIAETGSGEGNYSIAYTDGKIQGWIDIWGLRGTGDSYTLVITITEN